MIILITTIVLLVFILLLAYKYDIYRYLYLTSDMSDDSCIKNYMSIPKITYPHKVVISFTTTPSRIKHIKPMVKSILSQNVRVDHIALNIPKEHRKKTPYVIPQNLDKMLNIFHCGRDYGDGTKCIPTILRETDSNTLIILLEDNYIYPADFIQKLISNFSPDSCLYGKGVIAAKASSFKEDLLHITKQQVSDRFLLKFIDASKVEFKHELLLHPIKFTG
jgi:hypothetical protein